MVRSIGAMLSYVWLFGDAKDTSSLCAVQAIVLSVGNLSAAFWSAAICFFAIQSIGLSNTSNSASSRIPTGAINFGVFTFCVATPVALTASLFVYGSPFADSGNNGAYCSIAPDLKAQRVFHQYLHLGVAAVFICMGYISVILRIQKTRRSALSKDKSDNRNLKFGKVIRRLAFYPVLFEISVLPVTILRIAEYARVEVGDVPVLFSYGLLMMSGVLSSMLYIFKRKMFTRYRSLLGLAGARKIEFDIEPRSQQVCGDIKLGDRVMDEVIVEYAKPEE